MKHWFRLTYSNNTLISFSFCLIFFSTVKKPMMNLWKPNYFEWKSCLFYYSPNRHSITIPKQFGTNIHLTYDSDEWMRFIPFQWILNSNFTYKKTKCNRFFLKIIFSTIRRFFSNIHPSCIRNVRCVRNYFQISFKCSLLYQIACGPNLCT